MNPPDFFQLTLPSNSNLADHPRNTLNEYTIQLPQELNLDGDWEAALVDIQYPRFTIPDAQCTGDKLGFMVIAPGDKQWDIRNRAHDVAADSLDERLWDMPFDESFSKSFESKNRSAQISSLNYQRADRIPDNANTTLQSILDHLNNQYTNRVWDRGVNYGVVPIEFEPQFHASYDSQLNRVKLEVREAEVVIVSNSPALAKCLGFRHVFAHRFKDGDPNTAYIFKAGIAPAPPAINHIRSIYLYSDIIRDQIVGNTLCPLLGVLPVQTSENTLQSYWAFNPPYYMPIRYNRLNTMTIKLCSETGEAIPFLKENAGHVIVRMNFRRKRHYKQQSLYKPDESQSQAISIPTARA